MGRITQTKETRGSQKWIQLLVNDCPNLINSLIRKECSLATDDSITWVSPLRNDQYAEYRDQDFLNKLGTQLIKCPLKTFWPSGGPQWDALARSDSGKVFLVEAKANVPEIVSPPTGASIHSKTLIDKSFREVKSFLKIRSSTDWSQIFYQYANRLAHLYLLREANRIPAYLVFIYFMGDKEVEGPATKEEWVSAIQVVEGVLGLHEKHRLKPYIIDLFIDVKDVEASTKR